MIDQQEPALARLRAEADRIARESRPRAMSSGESRAVTIARADCGRAILKVTQILDGLDCLCAAEQVALDLSSARAWASVARREAERAGDPSLLGSLLPALAEAQEQHREAIAIVALRRYRASCERGGELGATPSARQEWAQSAARLAPSELERVLRGEGVGGAP